MGHFALYVLWAQSLWAPAVTPTPPNIIRLGTESITVHLLNPINTFAILFHSTQLYFSSILPYYTLLFIVLFV